MGETCRFYVPLNSYGDWTAIKTKSGEPCHEKNRFLPSGNKGADQLYSNCKADQPLFSLHRWYNSSSTYTQNFKILAFSCDCTDRFMSDLLGNPEDRFSRVAAQIRLEKPSLTCSQFYHARGLTTMSLMLFCMVEYMTLF